MLARFHPPRVPLLPLTIDIRRFRHLHRTAIARAILEAACCERRSKNWIREQDSYLCYRRGPAHRVMEATDMAVFGGPELAIAEILAAVVPEMDAHAPLGGANRATSPRDRRLDRAGRPPQRQGPAL